MSDEASTSAEGTFSESEKGKLLQQALSEAGAKRAQVQRKRKTVEALNMAILEEQKNKIRNHPLMPIVRLLMNKLEEGCSHMRKSVFKIDDVIQQLSQMEREGIDVTTGEKEIDELMTTTILSLRTQLAELQKVSTLTDSFYSNYMTKLKKRVNQETLVGASADSDDDLGTPTPDEELRRLHPSSLATLTTANGMMTLPLRLPPHPLNFLHSTVNGSARSIFPVDVSSAMPMPFMSLPFFSLPQIQSLQRQAASTNEETQE